MRAVMTKKVTQKKATEKLRVVPVRQRLLRVHHLLQLAMAQVFYFGTL
jgi:hypothetical protein